MKTILNNNSTTKTREKPVSGDIFAEVKNQLDIIEIARHYGIEVGRSSAALCPFHGDKKPSMSFKKGRFKCFSCGESGDAVHLVAKLFSLTQIAAVRKLSADFGLNVGSGGMASPQRTRQAEREKKLSEAFKQWEGWAFTILCEYRALLEFGQKVYAPKTPDALDTPDILFVEACREIGRIDCLVDVLTFGNLEDKINFFKEHRQEVGKIANTLT